MILRIFGSLFVGLIINNIFFYKEPRCVITNVGFFEFFTIEIIASIFLGFIIVQLTIELYKNMKRKIDIEG